MKNKKMFITVIFTLLVILTISTILLIYYTRGSEVGYIIEKTEDEIWVVHEMTEPSTQKNSGEVSGVYYETKRIPSFIKKKLKVGQKVKVYSDGKIYASVPGRNKATFIKILKE